MQEILQKCLSVNKMKIDGKKNIDKYIKKEISYIKRFIKKKKEDKVHLSFAITKDDFLNCLQSFVNTNYSSLKEIPISNLLNGYTKENKKITTTESLNLDDYSVFRQLSSPVNIFLGRIFPQKFSLLVGHDYIDFIKLSHYEVDKDSCFRDYSDEQCLYKRHLALTKGSFVARILQQGRTVSRCIGINDKNNIKFTNFYPNSGGHRMINNLLFNIAFNKLHKNDNSFIRHSFAIDRVYCNHDGVLLNKGI